MSDISRRRDLVAASAAAAGVSSEVGAGVVVVLGLAAGDSDIAIEKYTICCVDFGWIVVR